MKRTDPAKTAATATVEAEPVAKSNGQTTAGEELFAANMSVILASLQTMRDGDFSVRLPGNWTGLPGKIADTFNDIVAANQQMARELKRVGQVVGKEGRTREQCVFTFPRPPGERWKFPSTRLWTTCCARQRK